MRKLVTNFVCQTPTEEARVNTMGKSHSKQKGKSGKGGAREPGEEGKQQRRVSVLDLSTNVSLPEFPLLNALVYSHSLTGRRPCNEDAHKSTRRLADFPYYALYAVYDGHNGSIASTYCYEHLEGVLNRNLLALKQTSLDMHSTQELVYAMAATFVDVDDDFLGSKQEGGCTACVVLIDRCVCVCVQVYI
jgi:hypothetical protein